jgi:hypothetical protein
LERLFERRFRLVGVPVELEHLGEAGVRVGPVVQEVSGLGDLDGLAGQRLGLGLTTAASQHDRFGSSPAVLRLLFVARGELLGALDQLIGLVEPVEDAKDLVIRATIGNRK